MGPVLVPILTSLTLYDLNSAELVANLGTWDFMNDMDSAEAAFFNVKLDT